MNADRRVSGRQEQVALALCLLRRQLPAPTSCTVAATETPTALELFAEVTGRLHLDRAAQQLLQDLLDRAACECYDFDDEVEGYSDLEADRLHDVVGLALRNCGTLNVYCVGCEQPTPLAYAVPAAEGFLGSECIAAGGH